jgi:disulfide bond formation protein DsbB
LLRGLTSQSTKPAAYRFTRSVQRAGHSHSGIRRTLIDFLDNEGSRPADMSTSRSEIGSWQLLFLAWLVALGASLGALFVGEVMGQSPCNLCWHQRACMFPLAIVLAVASLRADAGIWRYALPLAAVGMLIAGFHSLQYAGLIPEAIEPCGAGPSCTSADMTILGGVVLPYLSLAAFTMIAALLLWVRRKSS